MRSWNKLMPYTVYDVVGQFAKRLYKWRGERQGNWSIKVNVYTMAPFSPHSLLSPPPLSVLSLELQEQSELIARTIKLFVFWILGEAKQLSRGGGTEGWDHPAAAPFSPLSLSLPPHPFIPSPIHPAAAVLWPSLSLCHKKFLPLFLYLSLRHKDGWRSSWNGVHNRLCHKVSSLSCIRLSAAFFSSCEAPYPTGVCVC